MTRRNIVEFNIFTEMMTSSIKAIVYTRMAALHYVVAPLKYEIGKSEMAREWVIINEVLIDPRCIESVESYEIRKMRYRRYQAFSERGPARANEI